MTILNSYQITAQLKETKFAKEGVMLDKFFVFNSALSRN
jgi:hypothetical protein